MRNRRYDIIKLEYFCVHSNLYFSPTVLVKPAQKPRENWDFYHVDHSTRRERENFQSDGLDGLQEVVEGMKLEFINFW